MTIAERQAALSREVRELLAWEGAESDKVIAHLESEGKIFGLDSYPEEFAYIRRKRNRRWREIIDKYKDLPPDTVIKLRS